MADHATKIVGWTPEDMMQLNSIGNVQMSPNGKRVVFTMRQAAISEDKSGYLTHIFLADTNGADVRQMTSGEQSCTKPQWSPDGCSIAFTSKKSGKNAFYVFDLNRGETRLLAEVETSIDSFKWSPDGRWIACVMPDPPTESEVRAIAQKTDAHVAEENMKMNRLWLVSVAENEKESLCVLTPKDLHVNTCFGGSSFDWSPDGRTIAFSHTPTPWVDDWVLGDISVVDVEKQEIRPLVHTKAAERSPLYSPDGKWIAFQASDNPPTWFSTFDLYVVSSEGGEPYMVTESSERWSEIVGWSVDSQKIYFTDTRGLEVGFFGVTLEGDQKRVSNMNDVTLVSISMDKSGSTMGFVLESSDAPREVYVSDMAPFRPKQITQFNAHMKTRSLGKTQAIRYGSSGGAEIDGLLTYPVDYQADTRYPLLVMIHGGPMGMFTHTFPATLNSSDPYPIAAFSARGYAVLRCNVRGSSGYGKEFLRSNYRDWGGVDYEDIMHGVDHVIQLGVADPERLGVMGWSYGGYLAAWTITQTQRFKAASVGAGLVNLISAVGTSSIPTCTTDYFGAEFWEDMDIYMARSPIFHMADVSTPTLIQSFEKDDIVSVTQGREFYHALKKRNIPTALVTYPRTAHGLQEPKLLLEFANRNLEWFDKYLRHDRD